MGSELTKGLVFSSIVKWLHLPSGHNQSLKFTLLSNHLFHTYGGSINLTYRVLREPKSKTDEQGNVILYVPLANTDQNALVSAKDYNSLIQKGYSPNWFLNDKRVKTTRKRSKKTHTVSRLIMGFYNPGDQESSFSVRHKNKDTLDLRRSNLYVTEYRSDKLHRGRDARDLKSLNSEVPSCQ